MKHKLLLVALLAGLASGLPATAQTGRIAHFSHGGSLAALATAEVADNLGIPYREPVVKADTVIATSDTTAVVHGTATDSDNIRRRTTRPIYYGWPYYQRIDTTGPQSKAAAVRLLQQRYPDAKLIGFDTLAKPPAAPAVEVKKRKVKRKQKAAGAFFAPPAHPGVWLAVATMLGLAGAGFLLGDKPRPTAPSLT